MEVHHHPHVPNHAKPWKEYLLEGLMIFVAVTLGYGAENIREHYVETKKAIVSAKNLYVDVTYDSIGYANTMRNRERQDTCFEIVYDLFSRASCRWHDPYDKSRSPCGRGLSYGIIPFILTKAGI